MSGFCIIGSKSYQVSLMYGFPDTFALMSYAVNNMYRYRKL